MNAALRESLYDLYEQGGLELMALGTRGLKRELIIDLETSALAPEKGEIIRYRAVNRWDEDDVFDEWASPSIPLSAEAERIVGVTNEQLDRCRSNAIVLEELLSFDYHLMQRRPLLYAFRDLMRAHHCSAALATVAVSPRAFHRSAPSLRLPTLACIISGFNFCLRASFPLRR